MAGVLCAIINMQKCTSVFAADYVEERCIIEARTAYAYRTSGGDVQ